jgi:peptidyl-prolyl cis-trans isomerase B (cyclophilin B)
MYRSILLALALVAVVAGVRAQAPENPRMVIETDKGSITIEFFQADAPKSVEHILELARRNFYRAQRIHRVERSLVQFGDRTSRDMTRREWWGRGGSGTPIGVAEFNKHSHVRGAVSLAHGGNAAAADSQMFIVKVASPALDGKHVVIGRVVSGMDVVDRLEVADRLSNVTVQ